MHSLSQKVQLLAVAGSMFVGGYFIAASTMGPKDYQVTGRVIKHEDNLIVIEKADGEKWELGKTDSTKVDGKIKNDVKVTIKYVMHAKSIEVKDN